MPSKKILSPITSKALKERNLKSKAETDINTPILNS